MHDVLRRAAAQIHASFHAAAQITIGKDPHQLTGCVDHGGAAQALGTHFAHQVHAAHILGNLGHIDITAHHIAHMGQQASPQCSSGV